MYRNDAHYLSTVSKILPQDLNHPIVLALFQNSIIEDLESFAPDSWSTSDITSVATIDPETQLLGNISAKSQGIVAGLSVVEAIFYMVDPKIEFQAKMTDGQPVEHGELMASVVGSGPSLLVGERVALNFLGRMSGVATLTKAYVDAVAGTRAVILDTRKTIPGWRYLDKYAVRMGGGQNHRMGLYDMVLIKDNHIDGAGSITQAIQRVRNTHGTQFPIEIEVKN